MTRKKSIPKALKWQVWIQTAGENFKHKCATPWCSNIMKVYDFHVGHRQAEALGGATTLENLVAICSSCNLSMGTEHYDDWCKRGRPVSTQKRSWKRFFMCWQPRRQTKVVAVVQPNVLSPL
jgi:hypothetical protein